MSKHHMIPMTQAEALALTKKLLGPKTGEQGAVFKNRMRPKPKRYQVGVMRPHLEGKQFLALGVGRTWEEALDNLSKKIVESKTLEKSKATESAAGSATVKEADSSFPTKSSTSQNESAAPNASEKEQSSSSEVESSPANE